MGEREGARKIAERDRRESLVYDLQVDFKKSARLGTENIYIYIYSLSEGTRARGYCGVQKESKKET